jgi:uncharacterized membrane protein
VIAMTLATRAEALFVSTLQPSDHPSRHQVQAAILLSRRTHGGVIGCAIDFAAEYGEHPEASVDRMRWALGLVAAASAGVGNRTAVAA